MSLSFGREDHGSSGGSLTACRSHSREILHYIKIYSICIVFSPSVAASAAVVVYEFDREGTSHKK